jgi:DNA polymerase
MTAADFLPKSKTLPALRRAVHRCHGCDLYKHATQAVFGEGPPDAEAVFIGEAPGDLEDQQGHPFVGPAGRLLDEALHEVGLDRDDVYVTNAVKHFKWEPRGTRRLHKKPSARELAACRPWLEAEFEVLDPQVVVCLGATAAQALLGKAFRITKQRGRVVSSPSADWTMATWHPSAVLRAPDSVDRARMRGELVKDLVKVARELGR